MEYRMEHDTMGEIAVEADKLWGAQTQRSFENFRIGSEKMPLPVIYALAAVKEAAAAVNERLGTVDAKRAGAIRARASGTISSRSPCGRRAAARRRT